MRVLVNNIHIHVCMYLYICKREKKRVKLKYITIILSLSFFFSFYLPFTSTLFVTFKIYIFIHSISNKYYLFNETNTIIEKRKRKEREWSNYN